MINETLRLVRVFHDLRQKELAGLLGVSPSHLNEIESGKKQVSIELLQKYAAHFQIPASTLLYFAERQDQSGRTTGVHPVAGKAVKLLSWLEALTRQDEEPIPD